MASASTNGFMKTIMCLISKCLSGKLVIQVLKLTYHKTMVVHVENEVLAHDSQAYESDVSPEINENSNVRNCQVFDSINGLR